MNSAAPENKKLTSHTAKPPIKDTDASGMTNALPIMLPHEKYPKNLAENYPSPSCAPAETEAERAKPSAARNKTGFLLSEFTKEQIIRFSPL